MRGLYEMRKMEYDDKIKIKLAEVALAKGIKSQKELAALILEKTGEDMRAATISDMYRNNKAQISIKNLYLVMKALEITDFNEILAIED